MWEFIARLFQSEFLPHGVCYDWQPAILWTHVLSDAGIFLSYFSIPAALVVFARRRQDLIFNWVFGLFAAFILACGLTHLLEIWAVWHGTYRLTGAVKLGTALISMTTAISLWPLIPKALALPSRTQLERQNQLLQVEIKRRQQAERELVEHAALLERRVVDRTAE